MLILEDLVQLDYVWVADFSEDFELFYEALVVGCRLDLALVYELDSHLLFGVGMSCNFDLVESALTDSLP